MSTNNASSTAKPTTAELRALESFVDEAEAQGALWWQERITAEIREARTVLQRGNWSEAIRRAKVAEGTERHSGSGDVAARFVAHLKELRQRYQVASPEPEPEITPQHEETMTKNETSKKSRFLTDEEISKIRAKGSISTQTRLAGLPESSLSSGIFRRRKFTPEQIRTVLALTTEQVQGTAAKSADDAKKRSAEGARRVSSTKEKRVLDSQKQDREAKSDDGKDRDPKPEKPEKPAPAEDRSDEGKILDPSTNPENPRARIVESAHCGTCHEKPPHHRDCPVGARIVNITLPPEPRGTASPELRRFAREAALREEAAPRESVPLSVQVTEAPLSSMIVRLDSEITKAKLRLEALESLRLDWLLQAAKELA